MNGMTRYRAILWALNNGVSFPLYPYPWFGEFKMRFPAHLFGPQR
jgi:hypothetical protein